jgi:predicted O-methyltransferase YrrM
VFNEALAELTRLSAESIVHAYDFSGLKRIVEVGGGYGELLACILRAHPAAHGVLFDLEHAMGEARRRFEEAGLAARCEFVVGDFFRSVPPGADAYVLKSVIHDWDDAHGVQILESCRRAMAAGARLLLAERIMPDRLEVSPEHQSVARTDLNMLIAHGARERAEAALRELLHAAGFHVTRIIVPAGATVCVIEARPGAAGDPG